MSPGVLLLAGAAAVLLILRHRRRRRRRRRRTSLLGADPESCPPGTGSNPLHPLLGHPQSGQAWQLVAYCGAEGVEAAGSSPTLDLRLGALLGAGSFGRVYAGQWRGQAVAVKVLVHDEADMVRVTNEVNLMLGFNHPNIVRAFYFATYCRIVEHPQQQAQQGEQQQQAAQGTTGSWRTYGSEAGCAASAGVRTAGSMTPLTPQAGREPSAAAGKRRRSHGPLFIIKTAGGEVPDAAGRGYKAAEPSAPASSAAGTAARRSSTAASGWGSDAAAAASIPAEWGSGLAADGYTGRPSGGGAVVAPAAARHPPPPKPQLLVAGLELSFPQPLLPSSEPHLLASPHPQLLVELPALSAPLPAVPRQPDLRDAAALPDTAAPSAASLPPTGLPSHVTWGSPTELGSPHGSGESSREAQTWLVLEYCDGGTLADALRDGRLRGDDGSVDMAVTLLHLHDVAAGMAYLHSRSVLHGDLKAANVLLTYNTSAPNGFCSKVADFGLSRALDSNESHRSTCTMGTVTHMPPELLRAGKKSAAGDVYAFGIMMWELLAGSSAFGGLHFAEVIERVAMRGERPPLPGAATPSSNSPQGEGSTTEPAPAAGSSIGNGGGVAAAAWPADYVALMQACWADAPSTRPEFPQVLQQLEAMLCL